MVNRPKNIGTAAETAVVKALRRHGFPYAERRALNGSYDLGDITGTPGIVWEVKGGTAARAASDGQIAAWLAETEAERRNDGADIGVLIVARKGIGADNAHRWWAILEADRLIYLAHAEFRANGDCLRPGITAGLPIRMYLGDLCSLLRAAGYGQAPSAVAHGHVAGDHVRVTGGEWQPVQTLDTDGEVL